MLFLLSRRRSILNFLIFTIHCDPSETEFSQCKSAPADSIRNVFDSSVVPLFLVIGKLGERTGQLWRNNSRLVRTHEKNSGDAVRRLGTIIQSIFCAQSGASIRLTVWKWSGESRYPGGAIHSTKISGNFGPKLNGSVRSNRKSFEKTGPPFEVVLFSRSDRSECWLNGSRPGAFPPVLENFCRAISPGPTDRPWVSEDVIHLVCA